MSTQFFRLILTGVQLIYNVGLVSGVPQSERAIHIPISALFQILFPYRSLQNIEQSSLCSTVGFIFPLRCLLFIMEKLKPIKIPKCKHKQLYNEPAFTHYPSLTINNYNIQQLLIIYFICSSVYMSVLVSQFICPPTPKNTLSCIRKNHGFCGSRLWMQ